MNPKYKLRIVVRGSKKDIWYTVFARKIGWRHMLERWEYVASSGNLEHAVASALDRLPPKNKESCVIL